jgi:dienelactone hydrolase
MKNLFLSVGLFLALVGTVWAGVKTQTVEYQQGGVALEGYLAYDDSLPGPRPGILVVHEWNGLGDYVKSRARQLAGLGYVAFCADIYGKGVRPQAVTECMAESGKFKKDRGLMRARVQAGLDQLEQNPLVDKTKVAAIGYCFGGGAVLELARSGAPVAGVVSFHGNLDTPNPADAKNIKGKVLVCQGGADTFTLGALPDFEKEMKTAGVDYKIITYPGAVHGFTNPANQGTMAGVKYDASADKKSWQDMKDFFNVVFDIHK